MQRSPAVESFVESFYDRMRAGDGDGAVDLVVGEDGIVFVGTDGDEWWDSPEVVAAAFREQLEATGGFAIEAGDIWGFEDGDVGWFADQPTMRMPDGSTVPMRMTGVVRRDGGQWTCVQGHLSVAADINSTLMD